MADHDGLYHWQFGHALFMGELLRQFIPEPLLAAFDLEAMERVNAKLHTDAGRRYEGDIIWRLPLRDGSSVYLMVLLDSNRGQIR